MEVGTLIRTKHNVKMGIDKADFEYKHMYYELCDGPFKIYNTTDDIQYLFYGKHFVCVGSDYWNKRYGIIRGFEILHNEKYYEVIDKLPDNLIE